MIHYAHWWKLVEEFVTNFNEYCKRIFSTSDLICADDSILRWYGQGGHWINLVFPMYVTMESKPENGAETDDASYMQSGIMTRLSIVKSSMNEAE